MNFIISAILVAIAGELDKFAARICKGQQFNIDIFYLGDIDELTQALTPPTLADDLPGIDVLDQVAEILRGVTVW